MTEVLQNQIVNDRIVDPVRFLKARTVQAKSASYRGRARNIGAGLPGYIGCNGTVSPTSFATQDKRQDHWNASSGSGWKGVF